MRSMCSMQELPRLDKRVLSVSGLSDIKEE